MSLIFCLLSFYNLQVFMFVFYTVCFHCYAFMNIGILVLYYNSIISLLFDIGERNLIIDINFCILWKWTEFKLMWNIKKILGGRSLFGAIFGSRDMESQENLILFWILKNQKGKDILSSINKERRCKIIENLDPKERNPKNSLKPV